VELGGPKEAHIHLYSQGGAIVHMYNRIRHMTPMYPTTLCHELCKSDWTDWFAVWFVDLGGPKEAQVQSYSPGGANVPTGASWDAEWGGSREHVFHWSVDVPKGKGHFYDVWSIEKHCKA